MAYDASASKHELDVLERKVQQLEREVRDAKREAESANSNLQLTLFAIANLVIIYAIVSR